MWGHEPQQVDLFLTDHADFVQYIRFTDNQTGEPFIVPPDARVYYRVGDAEWQGTATNDLVAFKVESDVTDRVRRNTRVQFCISIPDGTEWSDWVLTTGRVIRD